MKKIVKIGQQKPTTTLQKQNWLSFWLTEHFAISFGTMSTYSPFHRYRLPSRSVSISVKVHHHPQYKPCNS